MCASGALCLRGHRQDGARRTPRPDQVWPHLQQGKRTEIGSLNHIQPSHRFRQIEHIVIETKTVAAFARKLKPQILQVLLDQAVAAATLKVRQQFIKRPIEEQRIEILVKEILRLDEFSKFSRVSNGFAVMMKLSSAPCASRVAAFKRFVRLASISVPCMAGLALFIVSGRPVYQLVRSSVRHHIKNLSSQGQI